MNMDRMSERRPTTEPATVRATGTMRPIIAVTTVAGLGLLALHVGQQTTVQSAWQQAATDCSNAAEALTTAGTAVSKAGRSVVSAGRETADVWRQCAQSRAA
jgi:hypothetical protein